MYAPLALSVHNFIDKVGSDAGFASIIGLAILVLLYFAQARETSTLRDNAEQAEERVRYLEAQIAHLGRTQAGQASQAQPGQAAAAEPAQARAAAAEGQAAVRAPVPAPGAPATVLNPATAVAATPARSAAATATAMPGAPAGVGAPALAAATRLIPIAAPAAASAASAASAPAASASAPAAGTDAPPEPVAAPGPATAAAANAAGTSRAAGSNGSSGSGAGASPSLPAFTEPPPRVQLRPGGATDTGRRPAAPARRYESSDGAGRSRFGRGLVLALTALGVVAVVAVLLIVTSGGGGQHARSAGTPTTNAPTGTHKRKAAPFDPSTVTVTVLNGTPTSGAAAKISGQLGGAGYTEGLTTNADNQLHTTSIVGYEPGKKAAALHVAKALGLSKSAVAPVDAAAQNIACAPASTPCTADVVVTVGADLANK